MNRSILFAAVATVAVASACSTDKETQLTVALQSEAQVPTELDYFSITVTNTRTNEQRGFQEYEPRNGDEFPSIFAVIPADEDSIGAPIRVDIVGKTGGKFGTTILSRTSTSTFIEGHNLMLPMPLRMACFQATGCATGQTCVGGRCMAEEVKPDTLIDYADKIVSPASPDCFDEAKCLATKTEVTVNADCTFPITAAAPVNVAIRWAAAPKRILTLDFGDSQEGWTLSDGHGVLSGGVCDSHFEKKDANGAPLVNDVAQKVYITTGCASKTGLVPYCRVAAGNTGTGAASPE